LQQQQTTELNSLGSGRFLFEFLFFEERVVLNEVITGLVDRSASHFAHHSFFKKQKLEQKSTRT
jgi:hypothetical protein